MNPTWCQVSSLNAAVPTGSEFPSARVRVVAASRCSNNMTKSFRILMKNFILNHDWLRRELTTSKQDHRLTCVNRGESLKLCCIVQT
jgi:hypothetical protein